ncbi:hypothetical protein NEOLEDRAFT_886983 [Neolentinus lepideus HHB14362 ss-1]|uniref:Uncharacterized protein n=1 Tax=Neolentinus lepideus HHB14362 ss-1 TaxID=1314782 RepID=A0A165NWY9_9AGAM|nr:hypothetical protein NEOLEDRAFT_886983 [Neolentinus lepideus HHB14362 ss-1]
MTAFGNTTFEGPPSLNRRPPSTGLRPQLSAPTYRADCPQPGEHVSQDPSCTLDGPYATASLGSAPTRREAWWPQGCAFSPAFVVEGFEHI